MNKLETIIYHGQTKDSYLPWVGEIPFHWETISNKYIMHKEKRICEKWEGQDVMSLTMNGVVIRDLTNPAGKMPTTFDGYQHVYNGELLMCLFDIDVTPRCVGRVLHDGIASPAYSCFKLHSNADLGYYFYYYLMIDHTKALLHQAKNIRHSFTEEQLGMLKVPFPPLEEQIKIGRYLDEKCKKIDSVIAETKECIKEYKKWRESIIFECVTRGIVPETEMEETKLPWICEYPKSWDKYPIKRVILSREGGAWGDEAMNDTNDRICMRIADFSFDTGNFKRHDAEKYTRRNYSTKQIENLTLSQGDILIEKSGGGEKTPVGRAVVYNLPFEALYANFMERIVVNKEIVYPEYFEYYWRAMYYRAVTTAYIKQTTGIQNLNLSMLLEKEYILLPGLKEQENIITHLDNLNAKIESIINEKQTMLQEMEAYKKSLIYEVVTGKRKVV